MPVRTVSQKFSHPLWGRFSKNYGANQQRRQISDLHFDKFPTPTTFACWKIRFKTEVCTCSQLPTQTVLWIKEVELVDSVDDQKSSCSVRGIRMPDFEVLDAKIASALNRVIHNTQFKRKVSLEEQKAQKRTFSVVEDRSLTWSTRTSGSLEPTILSSIMPTHSLLVFEMMTFRNSIRNWTEFYYQWRKIPSDDILEGLYKLIIRESEKLKTVLELYNLEIHQKKAGSQIEDKGEKKYRAESTNQEFWSQKRKLWKKRRGQESGDKAAWTKNSGRLLAVESQRAVF